MNVTGYTLFLEGFEVEVDIGIHDFERERPQRISISIELELAAGALPTRDQIAETLDYDGIRDAVQALVAGRRFDLQETLARGIVDIVASRREVVGVIVQTAKPDVYPDVAAVGCRLEARR